MIPIPTHAERAAYREVIARHEANVEPITACVWRHNVCQTRNTLLMAVHDALAVMECWLSGHTTNQYQRAMVALETHHCGPAPSIDLQGGAEVGA